ncbi:MAG: hypothetical protein ABIJ80_03675 [Patescibacteria group bacterium]
MTLLNKNFYIKLAIIPFGAIIITILLVSFEFGINYLFIHWAEFLIVLLFLVIVVIFFGFLISKRLVNFIFDADRNIFLVIVSFLVNFLFFIYYPPKFLFNFHPFQEDLPIILTILASWVCFPFIARKRFFADNNMLLIVSFLIFIIALIGFVFMIIIDFVNIFYWLTSEPVQLFYSV